MTQDDFLKTLRWSSSPAPRAQDRVLWADGLVDGRPVGMSYSIDGDLLSTIRYKEVWLADRIAFMQEVMLAKAGFPADG